MQDFKHVIAPCPVEIMQIPKFKNIRIEINSDCNRKCVFCPRGTDTTRWINGGQDGKKQKLITKRMETDDVISLLDQNVNQGFNATVSFVFYNEPVLDDRLVFFSEYAKGKNSRVILTTNGDQMLADPLLTKEIFRVNDHVCISLYDYKDMVGRKNLMDKWDAYLHGEGIKKHQYRLTGDYQNFGNRAGLIDRKDKFMNKADLDKKVPIKANCRKIHSKLNIRYDGEVPICCDDSHVRHSLGNVLKTSISEVWYGEKMMDIPQVNQSVKVVEQRFEL